MFSTKLKSELIKISLEVFIVLIFFIITYSVYKIKTHNIYDNVLLKDLLHNWSLNPIKDIYVSDKPCDKPLFTREWEGIESNCDCRNSYYHGIKSEIIKGKCSFIHIIIGCKETEKYEPYNVQKWKGVNLCVNEYEYNFLDSISIVGNKCPKKYILCGKDTKNFSLCFPKKYGCPLNKIKFSNKKLDGYNNLQINEDWYLHSSNKFVNDTVLVDIKYSEGRVCINPSEENIKNDYFKFKKIDKSHPCKTKIGKLNIDDRYQIIDSNSKFKFYTDNDIMSKIDKLPFISSQDLINYNSYLYQRSYIHWSPYCRDDNKLNPKRILSDLSNITIITELYIYYSIFLIFIFLVYLILPAFDYISKFIVKVVSNIIIFNIIASILTNIVLILLINSNQENINNFIYQKCGEFTTNIMFGDIGKNFNEILIESYKILLFNVILFFSMIVKKIINFKI